MTSNEDLVMEYQRHGAETTLSELCTRNSGLVFSVARRFAAAICRNEGNKTAAVIGTDDLMQMGFIGLIQAVSKWEPDGGASFSTFAILWIKQSIVREMELSGYSIRLPSHRAQLCARYERFVADFERDHGERPARGITAAFLGIRSDQVEQVAIDAAIRRTASLSAPTGDDDLTLGDCIGREDEALENIELEADREHLRAIVAEIMETLPDKQRAVLHGRFWQGQTLRTIGEEIGVSVEAVREHERKALVTLGRGKAARKLRPYYKSYSGALHGSVATFKRTGTSSTERLALKHYQLERERWNIDGGFPE